VKILVTGATGFVAGHLIPHLVKAGHEVYAAGHDPARLARFTGARHLVWDLKEAALPEALPLQLDAVFHLAQANVPFPAAADDMFAVHVAATHRLLELARRTGVKRFTFTSTGSVYGAGPRPWKEGDPTEGSGYYAATKVAAERLVRSYGDLVPYSIFRLFTPYGPGQTNRLVPGLINRVVNGTPVTVAGGAGPTFNPLHVAHVVDVLAQSLDASGNQVLNLGGDESLSVRQMAETIAQVVGRPADVQEQAGAADLIVGDVSALRQAYRLPDRLLSFEEGVRSMLAQ
jgi:UDP-glucose 4-epimerase